MKDFNVYFIDKDGSSNHKILAAPNIFAVMLYMIELGLGNNIIKIERR